MGNSEFMELCTDEESKTWLNLESAILSVLRMDKVLLDAYITMQEELSNVATQEMR
jgi:hypothetical protein